VNTFLRDQRLRRALSAADVADRLDVHPMSVLRWERRERLPGPTHLRALASTLEVEMSRVSDFFDEVRRPAPPASPGIRGHGLRVLRQAAQVPARQVASRVGVPPASVYNWEAGRARIPVDRVPVIAEVLRIEAGTLQQLLASAPPTVPPPPPVTELRQLRRRTGLSQAHVARRIGATRHRLGAWERGERPPLSALRRLAVVYGVPVSRVARAAAVPAPPLLDPRCWSPGDLPQVLLLLRQWSGLTQQGLAERCECSTSTVRAWERGRGRPGNRSRDRVERVYGLPPGSLLATYPATR
jgi:transcriptional regulator with XRE-family HTH domain